MKKRRRERRGKRNKGEEEEEEKKRKKRKKSHSGSWAVMARVLKTGDRAYQIMHTVSAILESSWFFIFSHLGISFRVAQFDDEAQLSDAGREMNCTDTEESGGQMDKEKNHSRKCFNACAKLAIACLFLLGTLGFLSSRPSFVFGHQSVPVRSMK